jgi:HK97 family phage major capsid protein
METMRVSALPRGTAFVRYAKALAMAGRAGMHSAANIAEQWRDTPQVAMALRGGLNAATLGLVAKGAIDVGTTGDPNFASALAQFTYLSSEFVELLRPLAIIGRLAGARRVPFDVSFARQNSGASVSWVGANAPAPVSQLSLDLMTMGHAQISGIVAISKELALSMKPSAGQLFQTELLAAVAQFLDQQFISPGISAVAGVSPASITNGITPMQSSGSTATAIAADLTTLLTSLADADVGLVAPFWIMTQSDCVRLATKTTTTGARAFPDVTAKGGSVYGVPILASNSVPHSTSGGSIVVLLDAAQIDIGDEGLIGIDVSQEASVQMDSAPAGGAQQLVSLWQQNYIGYRVTAFRNWQRRRDEAVAVLDGCHF